MCGRFTLKSSAPALFAAFELPEDTLFPARYNIAPAQPVAVVRASPGQAGRELASLVWGLVPSWSKDPASGFINAPRRNRGREAGLPHALPPAALPGARGRILRMEEERKKQPYFFQLQDGRPFAFAGLWDRWEGRDGKIIESSALLTTEANGTVRPVHHRMPVILTAKRRAASAATGIARPPPGRAPRRAPSR